MKIVMMRGLHYNYKGVMYELDEEYEVDDEDGEHLLSQMDAHDVPFFQIVRNKVIPKSEGAEHPPTKPTRKKGGVNVSKPKPKASEPKE